MSSDDIVTLLRAGRGQGCTCAAYNWGECGCDGAVWAEAYINDAADEIDRLRGLIRSYADAREGITLNWSTDRKGHWHLFDVADKALLEEARRG